MLRKTVICILYAVLLNFFFREDSLAKDLVACVAIIPPHSVMGDDGVPRGGFVEVAKAIGSVYTEGEIIIKLVPLARSLENVLTGECDFHIPYVSNDLVPVDTLPFAYASEPIVDVYFVLYTRADKPKLSMDLPGKYRIETLRGAAKHFTFKISEIDSFGQGILKVVKGRSDGLIVEQDGADVFIREHKIKNIRRTLYSRYNSSIVIPKGPRGKNIDRIISGALRKLKESGTLQKITVTIHRPFDNWQPYQMGW